MPSFYEDIRDAKRKCQLTGLKYVPTDVIEEKVTWEAVEPLLPSTFLSRWLPCWNYELSQKTQEAKKVIAILTLIGQQDALKDLLLGEPEGPGLMDRDLPLSLSKGNVKSCCGKRVFKTFSSWQPVPIDQFLKKQWMFLEPDFELCSETAINIELSDRCSLEPAFTSCDKITKNALDEVNVYKGTFSSNRRQGPTCVALKIFKQGQVEGFKQERKNLEKLRLEGIKNNHLIQHLAICENVQCIIFPWASEKDLSDFWQLKRYKAATEYLWSFEQMAGLASGIEDLHRDEVNIRHGDLKPANILCFLEDGKVILKITDFGISRAHTQKTDFRVNKTVTSASTRAYEGPEVVMKERLSRRYDCWSMGCIVLEFVVWLLYDYSALESFLHARDSEYNGYYRRRVRRDSYSQSSSLTEKVEVHPTVHEAIKLLLADPRCGSTALKDLINIARDDLLQIEYKDRLEAKHLHRKLRAIFERARTDSNYLKDAAEPPAKVPEIFSLPPLLASPQSTFRSAFQSTTQ